MAVLRKWNEMPRRRVTLRRGEEDIVVEVNTITPQKQELINLEVNQPTPPNGEDGKPNYEDEGYRKAETEANVERMYRTAYYALGADFFDGAAFEQARDMMNNPEHGFTTRDIMEIANTGVGITNDLLEGARRRVGPLG